MNVLRLAIFVLGGSLVLEHEGVHSRADLPRRERDGLRDAVVERDLEARGSVLLLFLWILPEK